MLKKLIILLVLSLVSIPAFAQEDPGIRDTCLLTEFETVPPNSTVVMDVYVFNDEALLGFDIPLVFGDSSQYLDIRCDSVSFAGTRAENAFMQTTPAFIDNSKYRLEVFAVWVGDYLASGRGSVAKIYFTTGPLWNSSGYHWVDTMTFPPTAGLRFADPVGSSWVPVFGKGALEVREVNAGTRPRVFDLSQNYPNPFNPKTIIRFALPEDSGVKLEVYNILGQKVKTLINQGLTAGVREVEWDGRNDEGSVLCSGIYFYRMEAGGLVLAKKMVLIK